MEIKDFYKNVHFIDYFNNDFYDNLPDNVILIGGKDYDINLENKIKDYDCVIRIHNYRAINSHKKSLQNNIITKTDFIYTFIPRAINFSEKKGEVRYLNPEIHIDDIKDNITNLKGIIFQVYPYSNCDINKNYIDKEFKDFILKLYDSKQKNKQLTEYNESFANRNYKFYIEYINKENKFIPSCVNPILKKLKLLTRGEENNNFIFTNGIRCLLNLVKANKKITLCGFSYNENQVKKLNKDRFKNQNELFTQKNLCYSRECLHNYHDHDSHSSELESEIIKELILKGIVNILDI